MLLPLKYLNAYHKQALRKQTFLASAHWHCLTGMNLKSVFHIPKNLEFLHLSDNRRHQRQLSNLAQFSSVQLLSHVWLFATPWIAAFQASLSITNSQSSLKLTSIGLVMPSSHLILCRPLLLLPSIFSSIRVIVSYNIVLGFRNIRDFLKALSRRTEHTLKPDQNLACFTFSEL